MNSFAGTCWSNFLIGFSTVVEHLPVLTFFFDIARFSRGYNNKLTFQPQKWKKIKNSQPQTKFTGSYKKSVNFTTSSCIRCKVNTRFVELITDQCFHFIPHCKHQKIFGFNCVFGYKMVTLANTWLNQCSFKLFQYLRS